MSKKKTLITKIINSLNKQLETSIDSAKDNRNVDDMIKWGHNKRDLILKQIEAKYSDHEYKLNTIIKSLDEANDTFFLKLPNIQDITNDNHEEFDKYEDEDMYPPKQQHIDDLPDLPPKNYNIFSPYLFQNEKNLSDDKLKKHINSTFFNHIDHQLKKELESNAKNLSMSIKDYQKHLDSQLAWDIQRKEKEKLKKIWEEHKKLAAAEAEHWNSIMVLSGDTSDIAQKEIEHYASEKGKKLATLLTEKNQEHTKSINKRVNAAIKREIGQSLFDIAPKTNPSNNKITEYINETGKLIQKETSPGKFEFTVEQDSNFTGTLRVARQENGKVLEDSVDIVIYKDGKPTKIFPAIKGKTRITNLGLGLSQKKSHGIRVSAKTSKSKTQPIYEINTNQNPPNLNPPQTPKLNNTNLQNGKTI